MVSSPILSVLAGQKPKRTPRWLMRQAGRYLPEYRELREAKGGFLDMVYDSAAAAEITLQPLRRFDFDAAILFSDILIVPHAMGQELRFLAGEGPHLSPRLVEDRLETLEPDYARFDPIYETVRKVRFELPASKALLGFAGSPWTVATYMANGTGSRDQSEARQMAYDDPGRFGELIDAITDVSVRYLRGQIDAGADAVQLFDSWSGSLSPLQFEKWVIGPTNKILAELERSHPQTPVIGFPKGAGEKLAAYARETGVDAIGLDETVDPVWAHRNLPQDMPVQGNLDPLALLAGGAELADAVSAILAALCDRPHVFNLGHGILQQTPISHVEALLAQVRGAKG